MHIGDKEKRFRHTLESREFMNDFDSNKDVKPATFELKEIKS